MAEEQTLQVFRDFSRDLEALVGAIKQFGDKDDETYLGKLHGFDIIMYGGTVTVSHETLIITLGQPCDSTAEDDLITYLEERHLHMDGCASEWFKVEGKGSKKRAICVRTTINRLDKESLYDAVVLLSSALRDYKFPVKVEIRKNRKIEEFT